MRTLDRNKQTIYYATYAGKTTSEYGELINSYSSPIQAKAHISVPKTDVTETLEGVRPTYDKVLIADKSIQVNENTIFYIDKVPNLDNWNANQPEDYDYIATRVQYSLNSLRVELKKVEW